MADYLFFLSFLFVGSLESFPGDDLFVFPNNTSQAEEIGWVWGKTNLWARWNFLLLYISGFLGVDSEAAEKILPVTVSANTQIQRVSVYSLRGRPVSLLLSRGKKEFLAADWKHPFFSSHRCVHFPSSPDVSSPPRWGRWRIQRRWERRERNEATRPRDRLMRQAVCRSLVCAALFPDQEEEEEVWIEKWCQELRCSVSSWWWRRHGDATSCKNIFSFFSHTKKKMMLSGGKRVCIPKLNTQRDWKHKTEESRREEKHSQYANLFVSRRRLGDEKYV